MGPHSRAVGVPGRTVFAATEIDGEIGLVSGSFFCHRFPPKTDMSPTGDISIYKSQLFRACGAPTAA